MVFCSQFVPKLVPSFAVVPSFGESASEHQCSISVAEKGIDSIAAAPVFIPSPDPGVPTRHLELDAHREKSKIQEFVWDFLARFRCVRRVVYPTCDKISQTSSPSQKPSGCGRLAQVYLIKSRGGRGEHSQDSSGYFSSGTTRISEAGSR